MPSIFSILSVTRWLAGDSMRFPPHLSSDAEVPFFLSIFLVTVYVFPSLSNSRDTSAVSCLVNRSVTISSSFMRLFCTAGKVPKKAKDIASSTDDLPEPMTPRSAFMPSENMKDESVWVCQFLSLRLDIILYFLSVILFRLFCVW